MQSATINEPAKPGDYDWAKYLDYMEGGSDVLTLPSAPVIAGKKKRIIQGLLVSFLVATGGILLSELPVCPFELPGGRHPIEPVMIAIVLGMLISNTWTLPKVLQAGITFAVKQVLPIGIVLLGARLSFITLLQLGYVGVSLSVLEVGLAMFLLWGLKCWLKLPGKLAILLGVGTAICGGTAIVATAPVIEAEEKDVAFSVATVTLLGLVAMFLLPVLGHLLGLSSKAFGVWTGLAIHQTPQVIAAGFAYSLEAGDTATIVKLSRVCLLAPVVLVVGIIYARSKLQQATAPERKHISYLKLFPTFVLGFLGMALLKTLGLLPVIATHLPAASVAGVIDWQFNTATVAEQISKFCIVTSMAGVGLETRFSAMKATGLKPFVAGLLAAMVIALFVLGMIHLLHIG